MTEIDSNIYVSTRNFDQAQKQVEDVRGKWLDNPPPWRAPIEDDQEYFRKKIPPLSDKSKRRGSTYVGSSQGIDIGEHDDPSEEQLINLALILRRPLLVEGPPGIGKSTLAYHIAWNLGLGEPLRWEINSRTTLRDGLYEYRAVEHLRDIQKREAQTSHPSDKEPKGDAPNHELSTDRYITLGPLGTALYLLSCRACSSLMNSIKHNLISPMTSYTFSRKRSSK